MFLLIKELVPRFLKGLFWQNYLRLKFSKNNSLGKRISFYKDLIIGKNCRIHDNVIFGRSVILGNNVFIGKDTLIENVELGDFSSLEARIICMGYGNGKIKIGQNSYIGLYNVLDWSADIKIGSFVHIGPSTGLWTHSSALMCLNNIPLDQKKIKYRPVAPITIEDNVYIGGNCTIYPGITIRHHSVIAPNSAVTKNVESYTMVGGVPAKEIKKLNKQD